MPLSLWRKLRAVRRRLQWLAFCRYLLRVGGWACLTLLLFVLVSRLVPAPVRFGPVAAGVAGAALVWLIAWTWLRRVRLRDAALTADRLLGLKERLSTAIGIRQARNEAEAAVLEDAAAVAERIRPRQAIPARLERELRWLVIPAALLALLYFFMPQYNLLAKRQEAKRTEAVTVEARRQAAEQLTDLAGELAKTDDLKKPELANQIERDLSAMAKQLGEQKIQPEQAVARLDKLSDKLGQRKAELEQKLATPNSLQAKGEGKMTGELAKALEKGNFQQAAKALDQIKQQLQQGKLSEEQKAALQQELKMMAGKLGENNPAMAQALAQANAKMGAGNFNAALADLDRAGLQLGDMQQMMSELKAIDGLKYDMEARKRALAGKPTRCEKCGGQCNGDGVCESCGAQGVKPWRPGDSRKQGNGMGGPGIGRGGIAGKEAGQTGLEKTRIKGDIQPGEIIGKFKIPGSQNPGEATTQYETLRLEYAQKAEDVIKNERLPLEYKSLVRDYFDAIKQGEDGATSAPGEKQ